MKLILLLTLMLSLASCAQMSRQEVIQAVKECEDAGMKPMILRNGLNFRVIDVECLLKDEEQPVYEKRKLN